MIIHDFSCDSCGTTLRDVMTTNGTKKCSCGSWMDIDYSHWGRRAATGIHPSERAVIWYNPKTGQRATPGRNDIPMPDRYRKAGYERREFTTLRELDRYCKQENLVNAKANYDNSGNSYDGD